MSMSMNIHTSRGGSFEPCIDANGIQEGCCLNIYLSDPPSNGFMFHIHASSDKALNEFILQFKEAVNNLQIIKEEKDGK